MLTTFKQKIKDLKLIPAGGGCFELSADGELIYSKLTTGKFPDEQWVLDALQKRAKEVDALRAAGKPTLPTSIGLELETNPFLRPHVAAIQKRLGLEGRTEWEVFAEIREHKNKF